MSVELFLKDVQGSLSLVDMIARTKRTEEGIVYFYNENYIVGKTAQYEIFEGIWFLYHDLVVSKPDLHPLERDGFLQINYCISGRCELHYRKDKVFYVGPEDLIVAMLKNKHYRHSFPLGHYAGISISCDARKSGSFPGDDFPGDETDKPHVSAPTGKTYGIPRFRESSRDKKYNAGNE